MRGFLAWPSVLTIPEIIGRESSKAIGGDKYTKQKYDEKCLACERELLEFVRQDKKAAQESEEGLGGAVGIKACLGVASKLLEVAKLMSNVGDRLGSNELVAEALSEIQDNLGSFDKAMVDKDGKEVETLRLTRATVDELEEKLKKQQEQNEKLIQNYTGVAGAVGAVMNSQKLSNNKVY